MMMLGGSSGTLLGSSSSDATAVVAAAAAIEGAGAAAGGGAGGGGGVGSINSASEEDININNNKMGRNNDDGDRSFGGNRWPRQETLALLKIRSDMDQVFRDSSLKGPLWEDVSRKLAELGYNRSAKKCKEKFENVYKYHKRTKDGRTGKTDKGKHYKFFDQLQALDHHHHHHPAPQPKPPLMQDTTQAFQWTMNPPSSSTPKNSVIYPPPPLQNPVVSAPPPSSTSTANVSSAANLFSSSTSSSTASEEYYSEEERRAGNNTRKRKWKKNLMRLTKKVFKKQEELQDKFLEEIERRQQERIVREEAWRIQEMARINREHEILIQERSTAAAKDAAIIAFLQKISSQQQQIPVKENPQTQSLQPAPAPAPQAAPQMAAVAILKGLDTNNNNYGETVVVMSSSSSRWPKAEVQALIKLRTELANKYQENGPKGPLWEEISAAMRSIGYNRNAKRCKEKWENINKYFKKVKESNKKRPEDSRTCPYFDQLDALYKEKNNNNNKIIISENISTGYYGDVRAAANHNMPPLMVQPEQQWPQNQPMPLNANQIQEDDEDEGDSQDDNEEEEEEGGNNGGGYEIVPNNKAPPPPAASMGIAAE